MKFQYSPGLFGYGTKGTDGSAGLAGLALYFTDFNGVINYQSQVEELNVSDDNTYSVVFNSNKHAILSLISKTGVTPLGVDILPEFRIDNSKTEDIYGTTIY